MSWSWGSEEVEAEVVEPEVVEPEVVEPEVVEPERVAGLHGHGIGWSGEKYPGGWSEDEHVIVDALISMDYVTLRRRSHQMFETNMYGRGIIRRLITNEVHIGLELEARPVPALLGISEDDLFEWGDHVESLWAAWSGDHRVCDYEQRAGMTMGGLTASLRREALIGGDVLVVQREHPDTKLPTIQLVSGHQIVQPFGIIPPKGNKIEHGVETDAKGRHVAYYVRKPGRDLFGFDTKTQRVKARAANGDLMAWMVYGTERRIGQVRGVPLLGIVLQSLREIDRYRDSIQRKAVINSILTMWIEKTEDKMGTMLASKGAVRTGDVLTTNYDGTARNYSLADQIPGLVLEELQHGEKPHAFSADTGDTSSFGDFQDAIISAVLWACEIPPEIGTLSFSSNYSASAAALNEFTMYLDVSRVRISGDFNHPVYVAWLKASVRRGTIIAAGLLESARDIAQFEKLYAWTRAAWIGAVKPVTDILKVTKAYEIQADRGWITNGVITRRLNGSKFQENARIILRERTQLPRQEPLKPSISAAIDERIQDHALLADTPELRAPSTSSDDSED